MKQGLCPHGPLTCVRRKVDANVDDLMNTQPPLERRN